MTRCRVGLLLADTLALSAVDRGLLHAWLDTGRDGQGRTVSADAMAQALTAEGHKVGPTTVKGHRGKRCACYREG